MNNSDLKEIGEENPVNEAIQNKDWSETPLGSIKDWPESLCNALTICMNSNSPLGICWGEDLVFLYNDAWRELLKYDPESTFGKSIEDVFSSENIHTGFKKILSGGEAMKFKDKSFASNGREEYRYDFSASPIHDDDNSVGGIFIIAERIAESVKPGEKFQENGTFFRTMIDALPTAIYTTDAEGNLTHFNPAAVEFSGRQPELGSDQWCVTWKLYHTDGSPMPHDECPMAVSLKEGRSLDGPEAIAERPDGERIWFKAYPSPLHNEDGEIIGGINMLVDITDQKQAEKKLRQNEKELNDFFENANVGIHWVGPDGIIKRANNAELDMLGYSRDEYVGRHIADFHADEEVIEDILDRLKNRVELEDYEARLECKDGSIKYVLINSSAYEENGEFIHTRCVTRDITERKKTENDLREKEERLSSRVEDMKRLHALSTRLQMQDNVEATMQEVMKAAAEMMNADKASVQIYDKQKDVLRLVGTIGYDEEFEERFGIVGADDITSCATALKNHEQVLIEDFEKTDEYPEFGKIAQSHGMNAVLSTPLFSSDDQFLGMFSMYWENSHRPDENNMQLLDLYTQQAARQIERREAEQILRRNEEKYRTLFETMEEGFCILKMEFDENDKPVDWRYLETNTAFEEHTGLQDAEGKLATELMPELEDYWFKNYGKVALAGEPAHFEDYTDELERWFEISAFRIGEPSERKVAVLFNNITERKQVQEEREQLLREVRNERKRLSEIFQHAPSFMCTMRGSDHVFERANDLYMKLVGEDRDIIGKPARDVFPEIEGQGFFEMLDQVYETGEPFITTDIPVKLNRNPDSEGLETRYLDLVYQPLRDADGSVNGIFAQGVDLTERRKAKEELQSMNETLEERVEERTEALLSYQDQLRSLASQLSKAEEHERQRLAAELHDNLGQMLAVSKMKVDLLQKDEFSEETAVDIDELKELMDDALTYTRELMSDLKPPPSLDDEDVRTSIQWVVKKMKKHDLEVTVEDDEQPKPLSEDVKTTLLQCVRELLFNVVKHTTVNTAGVRLKRMNDHLEVTVMDKGHGFDPESIKLAPSENGGFGLFNVQERIDLLGGSVDIDSEPGRGTTVKLRLPLNEKDLIAEAIEQTKEAEQIKKIREERKDDQRIKVLLVDDHQMVREGLRKIIEDQDDIMVIAEAADGEEAINLTRETSPDIVLMDVNMPKMGGIEATKRIMASESQVRVIGLSLHDDEGVIEDMRRVGASAYLTKTEAFETLCATIRSEAPVRKKK